MRRSLHIRHQHAWVINGVLWACLNIFKWWYVPAMMISCQVMPFVAQHTKNTWPGMVIHLMTNAAGMLPFVIALFTR